MEAHLDTRIAAGYLERRLSIDELLETDGHVEECLACRRILLGGREMHTAVSAVLESLLALV